MPMERVRFGSDLSQNVTLRGRAERLSAFAARGEFHAQLVKAQAPQVNERIEQALVELDQLAARLAENQSIHDLKRYRQTVASLVKDLTDHALQLQTESEWDSQSWEQRTLVVLTRVNEELENLTGLILAQEKDRLAILAKMDDIKGMLLDMRM